MGDVRQIIASVTESARLREGGVFSERLYRDEPILVTASQMRRFLPQRYRDMRAMAADPSVRRRSSSWLFVQQARFMADYEDDYPYGTEFSRYFPTYQTMSDEQLRGYFAWRTRLLQGEEAPATTSFLFVRIYELINGVGTEDSVEGLAMLRSMLEAYGPECEPVRRLLKRWIVDYAAWNDLDPELLAGLVDPSGEESIAILEDASTLETATMSFADDPCAPAKSPPTPWDDLFKAIVELSSYRIESSRLFKERPRELRRALCGTCASLARYCTKHRKTSFAQGLFGTVRTNEHTMFQNAVFYDDRRHPSTTYRLPDGRTYLCKDGRWTLTRRERPSRGPRLGAIAKAVDACMREETGACAPLKRPSLPQYMERIVKDEVSSAAAWEHAHAMRPLSFDVSRIAGIRTAASRTCEALLVEEEREGFGRGKDASDEIATPSGASEGRLEIHGDCEETAGTDEAQSLLDAHQRDWLAAVLASDSQAAARAARASGTTEDLMADAVNEALFDLLGDTAVEAADGRYAAIEDYREDLEGLTP